ncbi:hypothetical protein MIR68_007815 [Amoeboaphelidium protococcarum]|nr:hypothetical protein MIR68_007815 [Amoeboaphelidium protococcarum]
MTQKLFSVEVEGPQPEGETRVRRNWVNKDKGLVESLLPDVKTLLDNFKKGIETAKDRPFLGRRSVVNGVAGPYTWVTYGEAYASAQAIGSFLVKKGIEVKGNIALYSVNRPEWVIAEQGCYMYNYCTVPLYDTLGAEAIEYILNQAECKLVFASADKIQSLIQLKPKLPHMSTVVSFDTNVPAGVVESSKAAGVEIILWSDAESEGSENVAELRPPQAEDLCTICYTSGTTGLPKGVMLSHKNMVAAGMSYRYAGQHGAGFNFDYKDVHISYLPLAHVLERALFSVMIGVGAKIGFYQGDTLKLLDDVAELKPTIFASVPRLYNRIYDKIWANVKNAGGLSQKLFNMAYNSKKGNMPNTVHHLLWDTLVFRKVRDRLGGKVRALVSGGAPLSPEVTEFLRVAFGCEVLEGYGQTETCAAGTITQPGDYTIGHVGSPFPCCEVKLIDVPEMGYTSKDTPYPRGEICFRGFNIFSGYYKQPEKTAETLTSDGWCKTGDIGMFDEQGRVKIIDRKKNIFKLAQGEYVAAEKIENIYVCHEFVAQAFVYGDSLQASLVGIIVPDQEVLMKWAQKQPGDLYKNKSFAELCKMEELKKVILEALIAHGKTSGLKGFENVKNIFVDSELFSLENNLLTPTFKLKRKEAKEKYQKQIDEMYTEINASN